MENKLAEIQEVIMKEIKRLDNDEIMNEQGKEEISRSNAISLTACAFIKAVNTNLAIMKQAERFGETFESMNKYLGL